MNSRTKFSYLVLDYFFTLHPAQFQTFLKTPSDVVLWEAIFQHFFQTPPFDTEVVTYPLARRFGSADPRWDILFIELNALKAQRLLTKLKRTYKPIQQLKEAA